MAGHSKWNNIKNRKGAVDSQRSKLFGNLAKLIRKAVKEGASPDPQFNATLRTLLEKAKAANMPKEKIQLAIDKGSGKSKTGSVLQEVLYEGFGPNGEAYLVQVISDNPNRTSSEMKFIFSRNGGSVAGPGAARYLFERTPESDFRPLMSLQLADEVKSQSETLFEALMDHDDVEDVFCSADLNSD